jgi:radical SAM protein with 4Fe4S-binding SPASM domain
VIAPPVDVFWELTRACDHACLLCRASAGEGQSGPPTSELRARAEQLVALRPSRVVLTGGEPTAHPAWREVTASLVAAGIEVTLFAGGPALVDGALDDALALGVRRLFVSLDGPAPIHDALRPTRGGSSYAATVEALRRAVPRLPVRVVTTVSRANAGALATLYASLVRWKVPEWQVQLAQRVGRAVEHADALIPPVGVSEQILVVLRRAARERALRAPLHCSVGYLVPEDVALRYPSSPGAPLWRGCQAGLTGMALLATGGVTGCACLPDAFAVRDPSRSLTDLWNDDATFPYSRGWNTSMLQGACARCAFGARCRAGCLSVAWGSTGTIGLNPYCLRITRGLV